MLLISTEGKLCVRVSSGHTVTETERQKESDRLRDRERDREREMRWKEIPKWYTQVTGVLRPVYSPA